MEWNKGNWESETRSFSVPSHHTHTADVTIRFNCPDNWGYEITIGDGAVVSSMDYIRTKEQAIDFVQMWWHRWFRGEPMNLDLYAKEYAEDWDALSDDEQEQLRRWCSHHGVIGAHIMEGIE